MTVWLVLLCDLLGQMNDSRHFLKKAFLSCFCLWFLQPCRAASWMGRRPTSMSAWSSPRPCPPSASGVSCPARTTVSWPTGPSSRPAPPTAWASAPGRGRWSVRERKNKKNTFCCWWQRCRENRQWVKHTRSCLCSCLLGLCFPFLAERTVGSSWRAIKTRVPRCIKAPQPKGYRWTFQRRKQSGSEMLSFSAKVKSLSESLASVRNGRRGQVKHIKSLSLLQRLIFSFPSQIVFFCISCHFSFHFISSVKLFSFFFFFYNRSQTAEKKGIFFL